MNKVFILLLSIFIIACGTAEPRKSTMEIQIEGMTCSHSCAPYIKKNLLKQNGVLSAEVTFENKKAVVSIDENIIEPEEVVETIQSIANGIYKVKSFKTTNETKSDSKSTNTSSSTGDYSISSPEVNSSGFQLPNLFSLLNSLMN